MCHEEIFNILVFEELSELSVSVSSEYFSIKFLLQYSLIYCIHQDLTEDENLCTNSSIFYEQNFLHEYSKIKFLLSGNINHSEMLFTCYNYTNVLMQWDIAVGIAVIYTEWER